MTIVKEVAVAGEMRDIEKSSSSRDSSSSISSGSVTVWNSRPLLSRFRRASVLHSSPINVSTANASFTANSNSNGYEIATSSAPEGPKSVVGAPRTPVSASGSVISSGSGSRSASNPGKMERLGSSDDLPTVCLIPPEDEGDPITLYPRSTPSPQTSPTMPKYPPIYGLNLNRPPHPLSQSFIPSDSQTTSSYMSFTSFLTGSNSSSYSSSGHAGPSMGFSMGIASNSNTWSGMSSGFDHPPPRFSRGSAGSNVGGSVRMRMNMSNRGGGRVARRSGRGYNRGLPSGVIMPKRREQVQAEIQERRWSRSMSQSNGYGNEKENGSANGYSADFQIQHSPISDPSWRSMETKPGPSSMVDIQIEGKSERMRPSVSREISNTSVQRPSSFTNSDKELSTSLPPPSTSSTINNSVDSMLETKHQDQQLPDAHDKSIVSSSFSSEDSHGSGTSLFPRLPSVPLPPVLTTTTARLITSAKASTSDTDETNNAFDLDSMKFKSPNSINQSEIVSSLSIPVSNSNHSPPSLDNKVGVPNNAENDKEIKISFGANSQSSIPHNSLPSSLSLLASHTVSSPSIKPVEPQPRPPIETQAEPLHGSHHSLLLQSNPPLSPSPTPVLPQISASEPTPTRTTTSTPAPVHASTTTQTKDKSNKSEKTPKPNARSKPRSLSLSTVFSRKRVAPTNSSSPVPESPEVPPVPPLPSTITPTPQQADSFTGGSSVGNDSSPAPLLPLVSMVEAVMTQKEPKIRKQKSLKDLFFARSSSSSTNNSIPPVPTLPRSKIVNKPTSSGVAELVIPNASVSEMTPGRAGFLRARSKSASLKINTELPISSGPNTALPSDSSVVTPNVSSSPDPTTPRCHATCDNCASASLSSPSLPLSSDKETKQKRFSIILGLKRRGGGASRDMGISSGKEKTTFDGTCSGGGGDGGYIPTVPRLPDVYKLEIERRKVKESAVPLCPEPQMVPQTLVALDNKEFSGVQSSLAPAAYIHDPRDLGAQHKVISNDDHDYENDHKTMVPPSASFSKNINDNNFTPHSSTASICSLGSIDSLEAAACLSAVSSRSERTTVSPRLIRVSTHPLDSMSTLVTPPNTTRETNHLRSGGSTHGPLSSECVGIRRFGFEKEIERLESVLVSPPGRPAPNADWSRSPRHKRIQSQVGVLVIDSEPEDDYSANNDADGCAHVGVEEADGDRGSFDTSGGHRMLSVSSGTKSDNGGDSKDDELDIDRRLSSGAQSTLSTTSTFTAGMMDQENRCNSGIELAFDFNLDLGFALSGPGESEKMPRSSSSSSSSDSTSDESTESAVIPNTPRGKTRQGDEGDVDAALVAEGKGHGVDHGVSNIETTGDESLDNIVHPVNPDWMMTFPSFPTLGTLTLDPKIIAAVDQNLLGLTTPETDVILKRPHPYPRRVASSPIFREGLGLEMRPQESVRMTMNNTNNMNTRAGSTPHQLPRQSYRPNLSAVFGKRSESEVPPLPKPPLPFQYALSDSKSQKESTTPPSQVHHHKYADSIEISQLEMIKMLNFQLPPPDSPSYSFNGKPLPAIPTQSLSSIHSLDRKEQHLQSLQSTQSIQSISDLTCLLTNNTVTTPRSQSDLPKGNLRANDAGKTSTNCDDESRRLILAEDPVVPLLYSQPINDNKVSSSPNLGNESISFIGSITSDETITRSRRHELQASPGSSPRATIFNSNCDVFVCQENKGVSIDQLEMEIENRGKQGQTLNSLESKIQLKSLHFDSLGLDFLTEST